MSGRGWRPGAAAAAAVTMLLAGPGCLERDGADWLGIWLDGGPADDDTTGDDDDTTGDDDDTTGDDDDTTGDDDDTASGDEDGDGWSVADGDCDDGDPAVHPGAAEACGWGVDDDCDGLVDEGCLCPLYVDGASFGSAELGSWDEPYLEIVDALDGVSADCSEIQVLAGSYSAIEVDGVDVTLRSLDGPATTVIDGGGVIRAIKLNRGAFVVDGFTLRNGVDDKGAGIRVENATAEIADCVIESNACTHDGKGAGIYAKDMIELWLHDTVVRDNSCDPAGSDHHSDGGGLWSEASQVTIEDCMFFDNVAGDGGGMYLKSTDGVVRRTQVAGNEATDNEPGDGAVQGGGGVVIDNGTVTLTATTIVDNATSDRGAGLYLKKTDGDVTLSNLTVAYNTSVFEGAGVHVGDDGDVELVNSIVAFNDGDAGIFVEDHHDAPTVRYCDVYGNTADDYGGDWNNDYPEPADGNLSADPAFVGFTDDGDPLDDDLGLDAGSPCIDAGDPDPVHDDTDGTRNDLGASGGPDA